MSAIGMKWGTNKEKGELVDNYIVQANFSKRSVTFYVKVEE